MKQATGMIASQFEQLFRDNYERLYYHAFDFVHDQDVAKDMVSDVFVNLWQARERIDAERVLSYLYVSVRNRCLDQLGSGKRFVHLWLGRSEHVSKNVNVASARHAANARGVAGALGGNAV